MRTKKKKKKENRTSITGEDFISLIFLWCDKVIESRNMEEPRRFGDAKTADQLADWIRKAIAPSVAKRRRRR